MSRRQDAPPPRGGQHRKPTTYGRNTDRRIVPKSPKPPIASEAKPILNNAVTSLHNHFAILIAYSIQVKQFLLGMPM
ncbi:MAG: hypothetical protein JNJ77_13240 [Planctomycetia bacterium]|nr:hypothetical protein [Planctomycetia bacterium]